MNGGMSCKSSCTATWAKALSFESAVSMTSVKTKRYLCTTLAADIICAPELKMCPPWVQNFYTSVRATAVWAPLKSLFRPYFRLITVHQFSCPWWLRGISLVEPLTVRHYYCMYILRILIIDYTKGFSQACIHFWCNITIACHILILYFCHFVPLSLSLSPTLSAEQHTETSHQYTP